MYRLIFRKLAQSGLGLAIIPIVILIAVGTAAYSILEGWSLLDALYATIITITTVGYGDLSPQTLGGRLFAILFTLSAIGLASYAISTLAASVIEWEQSRLQWRLQEQRMKRIASLENHIIVCGGGTIARTSALFFQRGGDSIIIVEHDEEKLRMALLYLDLEYLRKKFGRYHDITQAVDVTEDEQLPLEALAERVDVPYLLADPTDDSTLLAAGIERAKGLVAALDTDERNLFAVVSARALATQMNNLKLRIIALVYDDKNGTKLQIGGADQLVLPEKASGMFIRNWMSHPLLGEFWMSTSLKGSASHNTQQFSLTEKPEWVGRRVAELHQQERVMVLAVWREGIFQYAPPPDEILQTSDTIIAFATRSVEPFSIK